MKTKVKVKFNKPATRYKAEEKFLERIREEIDCNAGRWSLGPLGGFLIKNKKFNVEAAFRNNELGVFIHDGSEYEEAPFFLMCYLSNAISEIRSRLAA